jgi:hypothetical protein
MSDSNIDRDDFKRFNDSLENGKRDLEIKTVETSTKILERSMLYRDSIAGELVKANDQNREKLLNGESVEAIKPGISKDWANLDIAEFKKIRDPSEREYAAIEIANNANINKAYGAELQAKEPALYIQVNVINAANEKLIAEKEAAKAQSNDIKAFTESLESSKKALETNAVPTAGEIEARSIHYSNAQAEAARTQLEGVKDFQSRVDIMTRQEVLKADQVKEWAKVDAEQFKRIQDPNEKEFAAVLIAENMRNKTYQETFQANEKDLVKTVEALNKESDRRIEEKEKRKSSEIEEPKPEAKKENKSELDTVESTDDKNKKLLKEIPEELNKKFLIKGDDEKAKYYFANDTEREAFRDTGSKIVAASEGASVARSMVALAEAKGWDKIKATGKEEFRREVWLEGQKRGLEVSGYEPTKQDIQNAEKLINKIENQDQSQAPGDTKKEAVKEAAKVTVLATAAIAAGDVDKGAEAAKLAVSTATAVKAAVAAGEKLDKPESNARLEMKEELRKAYTELPKEEALKKHPQLDPLYKLDNAAKQFAATSNLSKEDQDRFVSSVRDKGLDSLSQGRELPQIKERVIDRTPQRSAASEISR